MGALGLRQFPIFMISLVDLMKMLSELSKVAGAKPVTDFGEAGVKVKSKTLT